MFVNLKMTPLIFFIYYFMYSATINYSLNYTSTNDSSTYQNDLSQQQRFYLLF